MTINEKISQIFIRFVSQYTDTPGVSEIAFDINNEDNPKLLAYVSKETSAHLFPDEFEGISVKVIYEPS